MKWTNYPTDRRRLYVKEIIHAGEHRVGDPADGHILQINAGADLLDYWNQLYHDMCDRGFEMPMVLGHSANPEHRRGTVLDLARGQNPDGVESLYALVQFRDDEAELLASTAHTSIFSPGVWAQWGEEFKYPLVHLGLTDYPEITTLGPFQKENNMDELLKMLGVELAEGETPEEAVVRAFQAQGSELESLKAQVADLSAAADGDEEDEEDESGAGDVSMENGGKTSPKTKTKAVLPRAAIEAIKAGRAATIDALVSGGNVTPAVAKGLKTAFATDVAARNVAAGKGDGFDSTCKALSLGKAGVPVGEQSGRQAMGGTGNTPGKSPLVLDAERRRSKS